MNDPITSSIDAAIGHLTDFIANFPERMYAVYKTFLEMGEALMFAVTFVYYALWSLFDYIVENGYDFLVRVGQFFWDCLVAIGREFYNFLSVVAEHVQWFISDFKNIMYDFGVWLWDFIHSIPDFLKKVWEKVILKILEFMLESLKALWTWIVTNYIGIFYFLVPLFTLAVEIPFTKKDNRHVLGLRIHTAFFVNLLWLRAGVDSLTILTLITSLAFHAINHYVDLREKPIKFVVFICLLSNVAGLSSFYFCTYPHAAFYFYTHYLPYVQYQWGFALATCIWVAMKNSLFADVYFHASLFASIAAFQLVYPVSGAAFAVYAGAMIFEALFFKKKRSTATTFLISVVVSFFGIQLFFYTFAYAIILYVWAVANLGGGHILSAAFLMMMCTIGFIGKKNEDEGKKNKKSKKNE